MKQRTFTWSVFASLGIAMAAVHHHRVVPEFDPKSEKKFFGPPFPADYPDDTRPTKNISKDFTHPYPDVQASAAYDDDFVKDENNDNGEWKAQADYDLLRGQTKKEDSDVKKAKEHEAEKKKEFDEAQDVLDKARKKLKDAEKEVTDSKKEADAAKKQEEVAEEKEKHAEEEAKEAEEAEKIANATANATDNQTAPMARSITCSQGKIAGSDDWWSCLHSNMETCEGSCCCISGYSYSAASESCEKCEKVDRVDTVAEAQKAVEDKIRNLEGCKKQLEDAQKQLKDLQEKQKIATKNATEKAAAEVKEKKEHATKAEQEADQLIKEVEAVKADAQKEMASATKVKSAVKAEYDAAAKAVAEAKSDYKVAVQSHSKEVQDVETTKQKMKEAEDRLRGHRQSSVHYSTASRTLTSLTIMWSSVAVFFS